MVLEGAYGPNCIMTRLGPLGPQFTHTLLNKNTSAHPPLSLQLWTSSYNYPGP